MLVGDYGNASDDEKEDPESNVIISNGLPAKRKFTKDTVVTFTIPIKKFKIAPPIEEPAPKRVKPYIPGSLNDVLPLPKNPIPSPVIKTTLTKINPIPPLKSEIELKETHGNIDSLNIKEESPPPTQTKLQQPKEIQGTQQSYGQPPVGSQLGPQQPQQPQQQQQQEVLLPGPQSYPPPQYPQPQMESPLYSPHTQIPQRYPPSGSPFSQIGQFGVVPVYSYGNYPTGPSSPDVALDPPLPKKSALLSGMPTPSKQWQRDLSSMEASDLEVIEINGADLHHNRWTQTRKEEAERLLSLSRGIKPTRISKRKGQITHLAFEAEQQELLEKERKQAAKLLRQQTKAKYGW